MTDLLEWKRRLDRSKEIMQKAIDNASQITKLPKATYAARKVAAKRLIVSATAFAKVLEEKFQA